MEDIGTFTFPTWSVALDFALFCCAEFGAKMHVYRLGPGDWAVTPR